MTRKAAHLLRHITMHIEIGLFRASDGLES